MEEPLKVISKIKRILNLILISHKNDNSLWKNYLVIKLEKKLQKIVCL